MVGAIFLLGICVGCLFITKLADIHGRKPIYLLGLILNFVLITILIFVNSVIPIFVCLFFLGISITCRYYVGYSYSLEFQPASSQIIVSIALFVSEAIVYLLDIVYFAFLSKNWIWLQIPNLIFTAIGIIYVIWMPETPRFLVSI